MADFSDEAKDMQPMSFVKSLLIDGATWLIPALILGTIGSWIGSYGNVGTGTAFLILSIWTAGLICKGLKIIPQQYFLVMERLGRFHSVKFAGIRWTNPFFDKVKLRECFTARDFKLYKDNKQAEMDFTDASAPITARAWYSIANPVDVRDKKWNDVTRQIALWTYRYGDPRERANTIFDGELRPRLQEMSIDEVQTKGDVVCEEAVEAARPILAGLGAYPVSKKALIIEDIALPPAVIAIREKKLEGEKLAEQAEQQYQGPARAISGLIKAVKKETGHDVTFDQAHDMVKQSQILEALGNSKANISFVASDIDGVIKTIAVGKKE